MKISGISVIRESSVGELRADEGKKRFWTQVLETAVLKTVPEEPATCTSCLLVQASSHRPVHTFPPLQAAVVTSAQDSSLLTARTQDCLLDYHKPGSN